MNSQRAPEAMLPTCKNIASKLTDKYRLASKSIKNQPYQRSGIFPYLIVIIIVSLSPFAPSAPRTSHDGPPGTHVDQHTRLGALEDASGNVNQGPLQAHALMIGKVAKVLYIKKKIKKLSKKLKKSTIALPVFTAIPIYEHSYYPQPYVTHVTHNSPHHAASSYNPSLAQVSHSSQTGAQTQQMTTSASNDHHQTIAFRSPVTNYNANPVTYQPTQAASTSPLVGTYPAPASPPLYVDDAGGVYGYYGSAYNRYDGAYPHW